MISIKKTWGTICIAIGVFTLFFPGMSSAVQHTGPLTVAEAKAVMMGFGLIGVGAGLYLRKLNQSSEATLLDKIISVVIFISGTLLLLCLILH